MRTYKKLLPLYNYKDYCCSMLFRVSTPLVPTTL
ncbi:hypothetical protein [Sulfolobus tengchongensis spindle-shaped virus 3]|nr:hypothetical protein [Sulfolobus tengchongensis spindle-shaped virus 3]